MRGGKAFTQESDCKARPETMSLSSSEVVVRWPGILEEGEEWEMKAIKEELQESLQQGLIHGADHGDARSRHRKEDTRRTRRFFGTFEH